MSTSQHRIYSVIAVWRINFVVEGAKQIIRFKKNNCLIFRSQLSRNNLRGCKAWGYFETIARRFVEVKFLPLFLWGLMGMNLSRGNGGCLCRCGTTALYPLTRATMMDGPLHPEQNAITCTRAADGKWGNEWILIEWWIVELGITLNIVFHNI